MTIILNALPYSADLDHVDVGNQYVQILPHQIIVWVSLSTRRLLSPLSPRFPAILDTGNTFGFSISEKHLNAWARFDRAAVEQLGTVNLNRVSVPRHAFDVWIHRNRKGLRDQFSNQPPYRLPLRDGIAIVPEGAASSTRLPLLGLRALDENKLRSYIHSDQLRVTLRTPPQPKRPEQRRGSHMPAAPAQGPG